MKDKIKFCFDFRLHSSLKKKLLSVCKQKKYTQSKTIERALVYTLEIYRNGLFNYKCDSDFLVRSNKQDLQRCVTLMSIDAKVVLRSLSFALGKSQAEILRLALECYLYGYKNEKREVEREKYEEKLWNASTIYPPAVIVFEVARAKRITYNILGPPPDYQLIFN